MNWVTKTVEGVILLGWRSGERLHREGDIGVENAGRCVRGPQGHPQFQWFTRTQRTQCIVVLIAVIYYNERIQNQISIKKRYVGWIPEETGTRFKESSPRQVTQDALNSPSKELWQHTWNVVYQGSSLQTQCPGILLGAGHTNILCLAHIKILGSQKESRCLA